MSLWEAGAFCTPLGDVPVEAALAVVIVPLVLARTPGVDPRPSGWATGDDAAVVGEGGVVIP